MLLRLNLIYFLAAALKMNNLITQKKLTPTIITLFCLALFFSGGIAAQPSKQMMVENFEQQLAKHKGEVIYIDFWASWCIPCRKSFPWMNEMQAKYKSQGLKVITINLDSDKKHADEFLQQFPANFDVVFDPKGALAKKFKLKGMPNSFMINRLGKLVSAHVGFNEEKQVLYQQEIEQLLAQK